MTKVIMFVNMRIFWRLKNDIILLQMNFKTDYPHLKNSPLLETSLSVDLNSAVVDEKGVVEAIKSAIPEYSDYQPILENNLNIDLTSDHPGIVERKIWKGGNFKRDEHNVVVVRPTSPKSIAVAFCMVNGYTTWEDFSGRGRQVVDAIRKLIGAQDVKRVGVRCIDRIRPSYASCPLVDVFTTVPKSPKELQTEEMKEFFYRDIKFYPDYNLWATVIRTSRRQAADPSPVYVLDTDVFSVLNKSPTDEEVADLLIRMRALKNAIFFGSIADKCMEQYT